MTSLATPARPGVVCVPGTHGWRGFETRGQWWQEGSPFCRMLRREGIDLLPPFVWTSRLAGTWWTGRSEWETAALQLQMHVRHYAVCEGHEVSVVSHSHGSNVVAMCAAMGTDIRGWVSVGMPVRHDLRSVYSAARAHVRHWLHLYAPRGDRWQWLGGLMDGRIGVDRDLELAPLGQHTLTRQAVEGFGHGGLLRHPDGIALWAAQGWLDYLR